MLFPSRRLDPKTRRLLAIGNIALVSGLLLWLFVHPAGQIERNWLHAVCGFLLGLSVTINLMELVFARRCGEKRI